MRHLARYLLIGALALAGCKATSEDPRARAPLVSVIEALPDAGAKQTFTGVIRARIESLVGFRVGGKIAERLVDPGQSVKRGQALMRLDPADLALDVKGQAANVAAAKARAIQADADLQRLEGLAEQGAAAAQAYDDAKAAADAASAQLAAAVVQAQATRNARSYATLTADSDGVVEDVLAEPGQVVAAGQSVVKLAHAGPREAAIDLPETVRPSLGSTAQATLHGREAAPVAARLRQLSDSADPATRTYEARYVLDGVGAAAPLGATVTIALLPAGQLQTDQAVVPLGALYDPGDGPGVWLVRGQRLVLQRVEVEGLTSELARVAGVPAGSLIVALGADHLRPGQRVRTAPLPGGTRRPEAVR